jgi:hypothetical protein
MSKWMTVAILAACLVGGAFVVSGQADDEPEGKEAKPVPTLKDLAWLEGTWVEAEQGSVFTEIWSGAQGDAMVGHDHWTVGGKTRMYELMAIEQTEEGLALRIRHFGRALVIPKSEQDGPMSWPLLSLEGQKVVFEHPTRAWPKRMEYERKGADLMGRLSGVENGKPNAIPFHFKKR